MEKNYLFQNYGYVDGPVNMKHVAIDILRRYGICIHMRDEPNGIYDLDKFLYENNSMGIPYHEDNIKECKRKIKENEELLKLLDSSNWVDAAYTTYYDDGLKKFNEMVDTNSFCLFYKQRAEKYKNRQNLITEFVNNFNIEGEEELTQAIKNGLNGCIEALEEDYKYYIQQSEENDVSKKPDLTYSPMSKEEWVDNKRKKAKDIINFCKKQIKDERKTIKMLREKDKTLRAIFKALEPFNKEVE